MPRPTPAQLRASGTVPDVVADTADLLGVLISATNPDGTTFMLPTEPTPVAAEWHEVLSAAANLEVLRTRAAPPAGQAHRITSVELGYVGGAATQVALIESPTGTVIARIPVINGIAVPFSLPLLCPVAQAVSVRLPAGGLNVIGHVSFHGFTR